MLGFSPNTQPVGLYVQLGLQFCPMQITLGFYQHFNFVCYATLWSAVFSSVLELACFYYPAFISMFCHLDLFLPFPNIYKSAGQQKSWYSSSVNLLRVFLFSFNCKFIHMRIFFLLSTQVGISRGSEGLILTPLEN